MPRTVTLYHTSPREITSIDSDRLFGDGLCFASSPYFMCNSDNAHVYELSIDESQILDIDIIWYHYHPDQLSEYVESVAHRFNCDNDRAEEIISQRFVDNSNWDADDHFFVQKIGLDIAKSLGYVAAKMRDEQGAMWLVSASQVFDKMIKVEYP